MSGIGVHLSKSLVQEDHVKTKSSIGSHVRCSGSVWVLTPYVEDRPPDSKCVSLSLRLVKTKRLWFRAFLVFRTLESRRQLRETKLQ